MAAIRGDGGLSEWALRDGITAGSPPPTFQRDEGRRYSARDIPCPECGALKGAACTGTRFCGSRIQAAVELARAGQLESRGPAAVVVQCQACGYYNGKRYACTNASHRCPKRDGKGQQCPQAIEAGTRYCAAHNSTVAARSGGGRKSLLSDVQVAEVIKRHEAGEIWGDIAKSVGLSKQGLSASIKRYRDQQQ